MLTMHLSVNNAKSVKKKLGKISLSSNSYNNDLFIHGCRVVAFYLKECDVSFFWIMVHNSESIMNILVVSGTR